MLHVLTTDEIAAVVARLHAGYAQRDAAAITANYAEDCAVDSPAGAHSGREAVDRTLRTLFTMFPDLSLVQEELLISGNRAVCTCRFEGIDSSGLPEIARPGKRFSTSAIFFFTFNSDHKIVHERRVYDLHRLMKLLAGQPEPASEVQSLYRELLEQVQREHELKIAADIQHALLPPSYYTGLGFEVAATSVPCRAIGGDFFDYFHLARGGFAFVLGDVAGKGPPAALLASMLQGIFTANALRDGTPAGFLSQANEALVRRAIEARFATAVYAVLDRRGRLTYCNAGHNPPVVVGRSGVRRLECGGMVIGAFEGAIYDDDTQQLESGDVLVLYSDGLTEARNPDREEFGEKRLLACVKTHYALPPQDLMRHLLSTVHEFSAGSAQSDDLTVLVLKYTGASSSR